MLPTTCKMCGRCRVFTGGEYNWPVPDLCPACAAKSKACDCGVSLPQTLTITCGDEQWTVLANWIHPNSIETGFREPYEISTFNVRADNEAAKAAVFTPVCECGGTKLRMPHSDWCPAYTKWNIE